MFVAKHSHECFLHYVVAVVIIADEAVHKVCQGILVASYNMAERIRRAALIRGNEFFICLFGNRLMSAGHAAVCLTVKVSESSTQNKQEIAKTAARSREYGFFEWFDDFIQYRRKNKLGVLLRRFQS